MFTKNKVTQSMLDAVNLVLEEDKKLLLEPQSEKVPTPTGTKVYGHRYGNSAKARKDQTSHDIDKLKGPKDKEMKEELKGNQDKIDANHNGKIDAQDFKILRKEKKVREGLEFADKLLETVRKSDVPAYLRKQKGEKPLTVADVKGPKKDTISHPENLAKARNEEVELDEGVMTHITLGKKVKNDESGHDQTVHYKGEHIGNIHSYAHVDFETGKKTGRTKYATSDKHGDTMTVGHITPEEGIDELRWVHAHDKKDKKTQKEEVELTEHSEKFAKSHGFSWHPETYGATMSHAKHGHININRYGEWTHHEKKGIGGRGVGIAMAHGNDQESLHHHLMKLNEETSKKKPAWLLAAELKAEKKEGKLKKEDVEQIEEKNWIAGAIKHPGAMTAAAKRAGETTSEYEQKHKHDSGKAGKRARLAITLGKLHKEETINEYSMDDLHKDAAASLKKSIDKASDARIAAHKDAAKPKSFLARVGQKQINMVKGAWHGLTKEDITEEELDEMLNEVLSKDATAGDWIHDFVHSDNPKFKGKSKAERKKMALGAYYGKQNEESEKSTIDTLAGRSKKIPKEAKVDNFHASAKVELKSEATIAGTPGWKKSPGNVMDKSGAVHTPMSRAKDLARLAFKRIQDKTKVKPENK